MQTVTVRASTRPGFCEIVFPDKPPREYLDEMKMNGFRWSPRQGLWYGPSNNLPGFAEALEIEQTEPSSTIPAKVGVLCSNAAVVMQPRQAGKSHAAKLLALAESIQKTIDDKFRGRLTNTPKRLAQDQHARLEGHRWERAQKLLRALAELDEMPNLLKHCTTKAAAFDLVGEATTGVSNGYHGYSVGTGKPSRPNDPACVAAWALIGDKTPEEKKAEEMRRKLIGLQFSNIPGYFPTPAPVIAMMLEQAHLKPGMQVLEPNLGHGAIADAVKAAHCDVYGYEVSYTLAEIAEAKGYLLRREDFLEVDIPHPVDSQGLYDRVLMNPPFEKQADIDHVMHAFRFLKPGGRLVAIMSGSTSTRSGSKADTFRAWLAKHDGQMRGLPADSFKVSGTGVSAIMVVVDKDLPWVREPAEETTA